MKLLQLTRATGFVLLVGSVMYTAAFFARAQQHIVPAQAVTQSTDQTATSDPAATPGSLITQ